VNNITQTGFTVNWSVSENAQGWVEYGATTTYGHDTTHETSLNYSDHTQNITGLISGTIYHFRVHAVDSAGQSAVSTDQTAQTLVSAPPPPPPPPSTRPFP